MKIGELAARTGCGIETIRYYERVGVLPRAYRSASNYRHYSQTDLERLVFIRNCRSLDMTLDEIRQLLQAREAPNESCTEVNALIDAHIEHVAARIRELNALETELHRIRAHCQQARSLDDCGILNELDRHERLTGAGTDPAEPHVDGVHPKLTETR